MRYLHRTMYTRWREMWLDPFPPDYARRIWDDLRPLAAGPSEIYMLPLTVRGPVLVRYWP